MSVTGSLISGGLFIAGVIARLLGIHTVGETAYYLLASTIHRPHDMVLHHLGGDPRILKVCTFEECLALLQMF